MASKASSSTSFLPVIETHTHHVAPVIVPYVTSACCRCAILAITFFVHKNTQLLLRMSLSHSSRFLYCTAFSFTFLFRHEVREAMDLKASWIKFGTGVFKKRDKTLSMSRIQFKECLERSGAPQFHSEIFQALDGDGDSELCFEELLSLFLPMHTRRELHSILETIERDEEKNGVVDAAFTPPKNRPYTKAPERHASAQYLTADKQDEIRAIFRIWDTDESGVYHTYLSCRLLCRWARDFGRSFLSVTPMKCAPGDAKTVINVRHEVILHRHFISRGAREVDTGSIGQAQRGHGGQRHPGRLRDGRLPLEQESGLHSSSCQDGVPVRALLFALSCLPSAVCPQMFALN